jgi:putative peptidoglycan lipid II flippase
VIVGVKVPLLLAAPLVLPPDRVVLGLAAANGLSFVVGAVVGQVLLHRRLGRLGTARVLGALIRMGVAAVLAGLAALGVSWLLGPLLEGVGPVGRAWAELGVAAVVGLPAAVAAMLLLRVPELAAVRRRLPGGAASTKRGA